MKTARFLLACAAASVLAACGSESITAPAAKSPPPLRDVTPESGEGSSNTTVCIKVVILNPDGTNVEVCVVDQGSQLGSGH